MSRRALSPMTEDEAARQLLVDAIVGSGFRSMEDAEHYTHLKLARFTGNQWNEKWEWDRERLEQLGQALGVKELASIYWRP